MLQPQQVMAEEMALFATDLQKMYSSELQTVENLSFLKSTVCSVPYFSFTVALLLHFQDRLFSR